MGQTRALDLPTPAENFTPSGIVPKLAPADPLSPLLDALDAVHISSILVGRAEGAFFARTAHGALAITAEQLISLVGRGATQRGSVQTIHVPVRPTYSVRCAECRRWIASTSHGGACVCGQHYSVHRDENADGATPEGTRCMNCGARHELAHAPDAWLRINDGQSLCFACQALPRV